MVDAHILVVDPNPNGVQLRCTDTQHKWTKAWISESPTLESLMKAQDEHDTSLDLNRQFGRGASSIPYNGTNKTIAAFEAEMKDFFEFCTKTIGFAQVERREINWKFTPRSSRPEEYFVADPGDLISCIEDLVTVRRSWARYPIRYVYDLTLGAKNA